MSTYDQSLNINGSIFDQAGDDVSQEPLDDLDPLADLPEEIPLEKPRASRKALFKRLADVVCLPENRLNSFERSVTADLLVDLLREATFDEREKVAKRLGVLTDVPNSIARLLLVDDIKIAAHLIEACESLGDVELAYCAKNGTIEHRFLLAMRKNLPPILIDQLIMRGEKKVIEAVLRNMRLKIPHTSLESIVALSQNMADLVGVILKRPELRPSSAYVIFWWATPEMRRFILSRFGVNREILQDMASDVFAMAAEEKWQDPLSRKALQFIERRQRNREALNKSPFESLDMAIADAARQGMTRHFAEEISYLSGLKPATGAKILRDLGGEALAVLCKATGLPKKALNAFFIALKRPVRTPEGEVDPVLANAYLTYELLAVDRAQTVLRYWNWSLSSALSQTILKAISKGETFDLENMSVPERAAVLSFSQDFI